MATRSPVLTHNFWGATFATATDLPNAVANPIASPKFFLQAGDFAYVTSDATFYICTNPGTAGGGDATWVPMLSGTASDKFAPKILVGNVLAGDSAVAYSTDGFVYIPDVGDGAGLASALAAIAPNGGDIHIRPGNYDLGLLTSPSSPLVIPAKTFVEGAGPSTRIIGKPANDQGVFRMVAGGAGDPAQSTLRDLSVVVPPLNGLPGLLSIAAIKVEAGGCSIQNVFVEINTSQAGAMRHGILVDTGDAEPLPPCDIDTVVVTCNGSTLTNSVAATSAFRLIEGQVTARSFTGVGGDIGIELTNTGIGENSGGCIFLGTQVFLLNILQYGVFASEVAGATNVTAVRLSDAIIVANQDDPIPPPPLGSGTRCGARLEAGFVSTFRSVVMFAFDTGFDSRPAAGKNVSVQIDDCGILFGDLGVRFGAGTIDSSVSDTEFGPAFLLSSPPFPITLAKGVFIDPAGPPGSGPPTGISVTNNTIHVADWTGTLATTYGVFCDANADNLFIEGNEIVHSAPTGEDPNPTLATIYVFGSTDVAIADNHVLSESSVGAIVIANSGQGTISRRTTVTGNTILLPNPDLPPVGIEVSDAQRVTITGNAIDQSAYDPETPSLSAAAIRIFRPGQEVALPARCTVTGNTIEPSTAGAAPAIRLDASENTCANNVCSQDLPPATSAIDVTGNNNVVLGNVCLTVPPVVNTGMGNEVAHNI